MKKLISMLLAIAMLLSVSFAEDDLTGEWYAEFLGMTMTLTLYDDATYLMDMAGDFNSGTWAQDGNTLYFDQGTEEEMDMMYDASYPSLTMNLEGMEFLFTREAPATYEPAAVVDSAALEDFAGSWATRWVNMFGMMLDPFASSNMSIYFTISGTDVTLVTDNGYSGILTESITGTFENGTLTIVEPAEDEFSKDAVFVVNLLEDGMLSCAIDVMDETMVFYLAACEEWEIPSAGSYGIDEPFEIADPAALLGTWYEEDYTLTVNEDGTAVLVDSNGYTENYTWTATDIGGVLTGDGFFADSEFSLQSDGTLNLAWWLTMTREPYVAPEPYDITLILGDWVEADGSTFTVSDDFTAVYNAADGTEMSMDWKNGEFPTITTGDWWLGTITVNEEGVLVVDDGFTHKEFTRPVIVEKPVATDVPAAGGSVVSIADPASYLEKNFICVSLVQGGVPMDIAYLPVSSVVFHENGMADVNIMGQLQENQPYMTGNMGGVDTFMVTYMGYTQLMYTVGDTGLNLNYMGAMDMHFEVK